MQNILIVDDSRVFRKVLEQILSPYFKVVGLGASGIEGCELYQKLKPDLVLMDITMPNCDGKEALKKIMDLDPNAKVIMVSGIGDDSTVQECIRLGAVAFVKKAHISQSDSKDSALVQIVSGVAGVDLNKEAA